MDTGSFESIVAPRHLTYVRLDALTPAARNPKMHNVPAVVESLTRFGFTAPCIIDERTGRLAAGHGRLKALVSMRQHGDPVPGGLLVDDGDAEWLVPVMRGWASRDDTEADALLVADNSTSETGGWNFGELVEMLDDLNTADATLMDAVGYTSDDLDALFRRRDPEDVGPQDPAAPPREKPPTSTGEPGDYEPTTTGKSDLDGDLPGGLPDPAKVSCPSCGHEF